MAINTFEHFEFKFSSYFSLKGLKLKISKSAPGNFPDEPTLKITPSVRKLFKFLIGPVTFSKKSSNILNKRYFLNIVKNEK